MAARFTQADIVRAVTAAKKAGLEVTSVEIQPDGTIRVLAGGSSEGAADRELREWAEKQQIRDRAETARKAAMDALAAQQALERVRARAKKPKR